MALAVVDIRIEPALRACCCTNRWNLLVGAGAGRARQRSAATPPSI